MKQSGGRTASEEEEEEEERVMQGRLGLTPFRGNNRDTEMGHEPAQDASLLKI